MSELPKHIINALKNNRTSLGDHPAFPPEEEEKFTFEIIRARYENVSEEFEGRDINELKRELSDIVRECNNIEMKNKESLEKLCLDIVNDIFTIPEGVVNIEAHIVGSVDTSNHRDVPDKTGDFAFDDIDDMKHLTDEIYKRRMLDALISGASLYYAENMDNYIVDLFKINSDLPSLYKKVWKLNNYLLFIEKDSIINSNGTESGKVDVMLQREPKTSTIKSEGLIFPMLLRETIKGILELSIANGLPDNFEKAEYVIKKSDFKLADNWDERLGFCLWSIIANIMEDLEINPLDLGLHFIMMELSTLEIDKFNYALQNIFKKTKKGIEIISDLQEKINNNREREDFENEMSRKNKEYQMNDDDEFTSDELLNEVDREIIF